MAIKRRTKAEPAFSMSSMTDIVFLLLIFFLVTSTLINPNTNQISTKASVSVSIKHYPERGTFSYHINGDETPVPFSDIEPDLQQLLQDSDDPTFSIYADKTVPIEEVVNLMNIAKRNKYKVILATSPE